MLAGVRMAPIIVRVEAPLPMVDSALKEGAETGAGGIAETHAMGLKPALPEANRDGDSAPKAAAPLAAEAAPAGRSM